MFSRIADDGKSPKNPVILHQKLVRIFGVRDEIENSRIYEICHRKSPLYNPGR
jgi:hypothetical protein